MISVLKMGDKPCTSFVELVATSTDEKPIGKYNDVYIANGSILKEIDTGREYVYNEEGTVWILKNSGGGGGGGGSNNYENLTNKPQINGVTLVGNKTLDSLGIATATEVETVTEELNSKIDTVEEQLNTKVTAQVVGETLSLI